MERSATFTDAILPLSEAVDETHTLYVTDWGLFDSLNLLHRGRPQLRMASGPLTPDAPSADEVADVRRMLQDQNGLFLGHVKAMEVYPNVGAHLDAQAKTAGLRRRFCGRSRIRMVGRFSRFRGWWLSE